MDSGLVGSAPEGNEAYKQAIVWAVVKWQCCPRTIYVTYMYHLHLFLHNTDRRLKDELQTDSQTQR